jgi:hypothetical protein
MRNGYRHYGAGSGAEDMVMTHDARVNQQGIEAFEMGLLYIIIIIIRTI